MHPTMKKNSPLAIFIQPDFFSSSRINDMPITISNRLAVRHSPLMSQPEGMCRSRAKGISRPVSMRKPAQSIRLP